MDDLEYSEFLEYPCRICGSIEYRYYGGGYNCREGHRNDELREQVADEDDFDFTRSQMRSTQLSQSKMTPQTARVATKKFRKRSGKGDHDVNERYGITEERQGELFEEERLRFQRRGDKKRHVILEAAMQVLILQIDCVKNNYNFSNLWSANIAEIERKKEEFESLARNLFRAYANQLSFPYSHTDTLHPELTALAPPFQATRHFRNQQNNNNPSASDSPNFMEDDHPNFDDLLDRELLLENYDYGNESSVSDSENETNSAPTTSTKLNVELSRLLETTNNTNTVPSDTSNNIFKATRFPRKRTRPLRSPYSYLNMTFLTYLALVHTGVPILFSDLARALELGNIPGYRPDFQLSKDIVTVRFNINEVRAFHTRLLPETDQLYYDSRLILEMLAKQCRVPDWLLNESAEDTLMLRLMGEMSLPAPFFPYIKSHVRRVSGPLNFMILKGDLYLTPCALISAAIVFFLRLLYTLEYQDEDEEESSDSRVINQRLISQGLPTQSDLIKEWTKRIEEKTLLTESEDPITDPEEYAQLLELANRLLAPTCILDNKSSIKGIFGNEKYERTMKIRNTRRENFRFVDLKDIREINLPCDNFKCYRSYPYSINLNALPSAYKLALRLLQMIVGIRPVELEIIIKRVFETQDSTVLERDRVCEYKRKGGRKGRERIESEVYLYY